MSCDRCELYVCRWYSLQYNAMFFYQTQRIIRPQALALNGNALAHAADSASADWSDCMNSTRKPSPPKLWTMTSNIRCYMKWINQLFYRRIGTDYLACIETWNRSFFFKQIYSNMICKQRKVTVVNLNRHFTFKSRYHLCRRQNLWHPYEIAYSDCNLLWDRINHQIKSVAVKVVMCSKDSYGCGCIK